MELIKTILPFLATLAVFFCGMYLNQLQKSHNDLLAEFRSFKDEVLRNYVKQTDVDKIWNSIDKMRDK